MKRVILSVTGTVVGVVALLSFKTRSPLATPDGGLPAAALSGTSSSATSPTATSTGAPPDSSATRGSVAGSTPTSTSATATSYVGAAERTRYGIVQVKITVTGTEITNVGFVQLTAFDGRSQQINSNAAPTLLQETLEAQNADIHSVSGASYTSQGYVQSLQSALDKAGI
jgi:uncharacterized protein with FMN-binding domain